MKEDFWDDPEKASVILKKKTRLSLIVENWNQKKVAIDDTGMLFELASNEEDMGFLEEIDRDLQRLRSSVRDEELKLMLGLEQDPMKAIMTIHAGAGGTEAQDC